MRWDEIDQIIPSYATIKHLPFKHCWSSSRMALRDARTLFLKLGTFDDTRYCWSISNVRPRKAAELLLHLLLLSIFWQPLCVLGPFFWCFYFFKLLYIRVKYIESPIYLVSILNTWLERAIKNETIHLPVRNMVISYPFYFHFYFCILFYYQRLSHYF